MKLAVQHFSSLKPFLNTFISRAIFLIYIFLFISMLGSVIGSNWTSGAVLLSFGGHVIFSFIIGRTIPSFGVSTFYLFLLRHEIPRLVSVNFELPKFLPNLLNFFNQLDELKIRVGIFTFGLQFLVLCLVRKKIKNIYIHVLHRDAKETHFSFSFTFPKNAGNEKRKFVFRFQIKIFDM